MTPRSAPAPDASSDTDPDAALVALVERMRAGDVSALAGFQALALGPVYAIALRVLGNPADAEEVVGDVFLQAWEQSVDYQPGRGTVMAWLRTLAWSRAQDRRRRRRHLRHELPLHPEGGEDAYTASEDHAPHAMTDRIADAQALAQAATALSPAQRQVLALAYGEELSHPEIAARTGLPLGTVKSHARRGLAALRQALGARDD